MGNPRSQFGRVIATDGARTMYGRMLSLWASDLLLHPPSLAWSDEITDADRAYRDHDWQRLYSGSVLDD